MKQNPADHIAIALDNLENEHQIQLLVEQTRPLCATYKIGLELFTRYGPSILRIIREAGGNIFLDLKFHDIPNTVSKAVLSVSSLQARFCTLHATGGRAMMSAAAAAARAAREKGLSPPKLIAVTVLTSIDQQSLRDDGNVCLSINDHVEHLIRLAIETGMDGVVCSAADLPHVQKTILGAPAGFEVITPGIRRGGASLHDQKRTATPAQALANGATLLVLGREVSLSPDPAATLREIIADLS